MNKRVSPIQASRADTDKPFGSLENSLTEMLEDVGRFAERLVLRTLVLLTTRMNIGKLPSVLVRPGRCLSRIEFEPFSAREARRWLGRSA